MMSTELLSKKRSIVEHYLKQKVLLSREVLQKLQSQEYIEEEFAKISVVPQEMPRKSSPVVEVKKEFFFEKENFSVADVTSFFRTRFKQLERMLMERSELQGLTSIRRLEEKSEREKVSIIAMVYSKDLTKNGNLMFTVEDATGRFKVMVSKSSPAFSVAEDTSLDEVLGIVGSLGNKIIFANTIVYPDVPLLTELKRSSDEAYVVCLSCVHFGSRLFLPERWNNFVEWINGRFGDEKLRAIAEKVKYIVISGDLVDGIGIFPEQEKELAIKDIYEQYSFAAKELARIPHDKAIIYCSGNHDACRIAEPQPRIYEDFAGPVHDLPHVTIVTNPAWVNIHKSDDFPGFDLLLYHGFSYTYYGDSVQSIRDSGLPVSDRTGLIMKYLLQRRHLSPAYKSTRTVFNPKQDCNVIFDVPDLFISGHIHKAVLGSYRGVSLIAGSCFQSNSAYQEKFGHIPAPAVIPLINLKTRQMSMVEF